MTDSEGLNIEQIMRQLPHRYPFLLIDKVVEMERFKRIVAIKSVTIGPGSSASATQAAMKAR